MRRSCIVTAFVIIGMALGTSGATHAADAEERSSAAATLSDFQAVMSAGGCRADAVADPRFVADAKNALRPVIHAEDSGAMLTNKRHVVMAYSAIFVLLVVFVVLLSMRQRKLSLEIDRLARDLEKALAEEAP